MSAEEAGKRVVEPLNKGVAPQSVWDAVFGAAGEMLMRKPGIVSLHSLTTANAMRYRLPDVGRRRDAAVAAPAGGVVQRPVPRRVGQPQGEGDRRPVRQLEPLAPKESGAAAVDEIFADVSKDRATAARKVLGYLKANPDPRPLTDAARRLVFRKGTDSHDYKFSSAVLEDCATCRRPGGTGSWRRACTG